MTTLYSQLLLLTAGLLPAYVIRFSFAQVPTNVLEAAIWLTAVLGALQPAIRRSWIKALRSLPKPILIACILFLASSVLSTAISPHPDTSLGILKGWIVTPMLFGWMIYAAQIAGGATGVPRQGRSSSEHLVGVQAATGPAVVVKALILSGLVVALLGLSQLGHLDRIRGPYDVPNSLALFLAPLIVLSLFQRSQFFRLTSVPMFIALLFTQSLAGVLSVGVVLAFVLLRVAPWRGAFYGAKWGHWVLIAAAVVLGAIIFTPKIEYLTQPGSSAYVRLQLWSISWDLIKENPLLGIGLGTFEPAYQQKLHERFLQFENFGIGHSLGIGPWSLGFQTQPLPEFVFRDPHNWLLSFWLNLGLLGLISFVALHVYVFYWAFRHWSFIRHWSLSIGICGALATLLLFGLVDTIFWKNDLAALYFLLMATVLSHNQA